MFRFNITEVKMSRKNEKKETSRFNPFSWMTRDGIGVEDDEPPILDDPGIKNYFKLIGRRFNQLVTINLMLLIGNFPIIFALAVLSGYFSINSTAPIYSIFAQVNGAHMASPNAYTSAIFGTFAGQGDIVVLSTTDYVFIGLTFLVLLTFGCVMAGSVYLFRGMIRDEHIFIWHDFWHCIKKNFKQAIPFGIFDLAITAIIMYDIVFFNLNYAQSIATMMMFFASLILAVLYIIMRMYIYPMMITFDLSLGKLFKNALLFTILGIKRNAVAVLIIAAITAIDFFMIGVFLPVGILLPFVIVFSLLTYTGVYWAYPVISKYMIEPYYNKDGTPKSAVAAGDSEEGDDYDAEIEE